MEHAEDLDDCFLNAANEYPDLDYTPSYPWVGALNGFDQLTQRDSQNVPHESSRKVVESQPNGMWQEDEGNKRAHGATETLEDASHGSSARWRVKGDANDAQIDPDFELTEESCTYVLSALYIPTLLICAKFRSDELNSEMDSETPYSSAQDRQSRFQRNQKGRGNRRRVGMGHTRRGGRGVKGTRRSHWKPLEPSVEFKALHSQATMAFIDHEYEEAEQLALQAILLNPEMFPAYSLLSEIHMAQGNSAKALASLFNGAHTRPRDTQVWSKVAQLIIERAGEDKLSVIRDAMYCYNRVIAVDKTDVRARFKRAALNRDLGHDSKAAYDYEYLLKQFPHDTAILRLLAETCIDMNDVDRAIHHYRRSLSHYQAKEPEQVISVVWSDINVYTELYGIQREYAKGISLIKSLSRWLLGRSSDTLWEAVVEDDREWDREDHSRRAQLEGFIPGLYESSTYGDGLPLELRIKLGIYRLKLGDENLDEAIVKSQFGPRIMGC